MIVHVLWEMCVFQVEVSCCHINSVATGRFEWDFRKVIFTLALVADGWGSACEITLKWILMDVTDDQSTSVKVMTSQFNKRLTITSLYSINSIL